MSTTPAGFSMTVEEYLSNPDYEHFEFEDGHVVELNVGTKTHARLQIRIGRLLGQFTDSLESADVFTELHCLLTVQGRTRFYLPDVAVVIGDFDDRYLDRAPDLAVEIRSPSDRMSRMVDKAQHYLASGAKLVWLVLPEEESVIVFRGNGAPESVTGEGNLEGDEVLPGLRIPLASIFR